MAHLFLSYAREDLACAQTLAQALTNRGWSVWWDRRIQIGRSFSEVIEQELAKARCVIVLWSQHSVTSDWVQSEAAEAARRGVLVPIRIEDVRPPLEFRRLHTADLRDWNKGLESREFDSCVEAIELLVKKTAAGNVPTPVEPERSEAPGFLINQDGRQFRAPDLATVRQWAEEGRVKPESYIYGPGFRQWVRARDVAEVRGAFESAPAVIPSVARDLGGGAPSVSPPAQVPRSARDDTPAPRRSFALPAMLLGGAGLLLLTIVVVIVAAYRRSSAEAIPFAGVPETIDTVMTDVVTKDPVPVPVPSYVVSVTLENACMDELIHVAICYQNAANVWISTGWYTVYPQQTLPNVLQAHGSAVYFYGESATTRWEGRAEDPLKQMFPVRRPEPFTAPIDQFYGAGVSSASFQGRAFDGSGPVVIQRFLCD